jgi:hypothetical protein
MPRRSVISELERMLDSLPKLNEESLEMALERLETLGVEMPDGPVRRPGVTCPVTQLPLVTSCNISDCPYSIDNEWHRNCLMDYMVTQDGESLAVEEIAFLYQETPSKVQKIIETGMASLRKTSMESMGFEGDFHREQPPEVKANLGEDDEFAVTRSTLSPGFLRKTNEVLEAAVESELVYRHPAIRLLGILDSIIDEL